MISYLRAYPMVVLLLPLVAVILFFVDRPPKYAPKVAPNAVQTTLYERLAAAGLSGDELATVGALTLGYKEELSKDLRRHFQASGAAHVLAVSGLHTGIIYGLLWWLLSFGGRYKPLYENKWGRRSISLLIIAVMWCYAWLTGMTPSVVRAVLMVTIFEVGRMLYRQAFSMNTVAAAAVFILLVKPSDLWSVSFQLSFAATASIIVLANIAGPTIQYNILKKNALGKVFNWVIGVMAVSLAAQLGTMPITMYYFHQISNYFLLTNLIVLPLATILVPCGLLSIVFGGTWAGQMIGFITNRLAWTMNHSVEWIEHLPGSTTHISISLMMVGIYYALLIGFVLSIPRKKV